MEFDYTKEPGQKLLSRNQSNDGKPLVSIITPYYNAGKYFEQTFNCVMNQTFPWFEWIIADDGSTNINDVVILHNYAEKDNRIRVITKENGGISTARNAAIREAQTDIIIPLDADDLITPTYVEILYWALIKSPDYSWSYSCNVGFQNQEYLWDKPFDSKLLTTYNFLVYSGAIRKSAIELVGGYDEITKHYYEDWRFWLKMLTAHLKPVKTRNYGFWYRRMDTGVLSIVNKDPQVQKLAKQLIAEVAETADTSIQAKEYPYGGKPGEYAAPKCSDWNRKVFKSHDKIHVMMLLPWMEMGGADLFNLDVCRKIDKERFEVSILTTVPGEQSWRQRFEDYVTDIFDLPSFLEPKDFPEFISYFIKSREVDVLFLSNSYDGYYLVPWLRAQFPELAIIDYVHMEEWYWRNGGYARTSGAMGEILEKTYVCNERTRRVLINDFGRDPESVETLYIGVDQEQYDETKVEASLVRKELNIAEDRPIILFPCRIHPQKRPFLMVEIAKQIKQSIPNIAFVVVGDGPQFEELKIAIERENLPETVYLAGRQKDMRPYYKDSALTLICSLKEGLALTAYESLSMGKPVVTSDVGGQAELIDDTVGRVLPLLQSEADELDSRTFSQEEVQMYVKAITDVLADREQYQQLCRNCRRKIEEGFSSQIMIRKLERIFGDLIRNSEKNAARIRIADCLNQFERLTEDSYMMYHLYEASQREAETVWKSREWFRELYENAMGAHTKLPAEMHNEPTVMLPDAITRLYRNGDIGFKYIIKYMIAWLKYKIKGSN